MVFSRLLLLPTAVLGFVYKPGESYRHPVDLPLTRNDNTFSGELHVDTYVMENEEGTCRMHFRGYNGGSLPTIRIPENSILNIDYFNDLAIDLGEQPPHNTPRDFNITNLHSHGGHVSTKAPADDVTLVVEGDGGHFAYSFDFADQRAGTLWYHAHHHGSTSVQVASGVVGALIVEDNPETTPEWVMDMPELDILIREFETSWFSDTGPYSPDNLRLQNVMEGCPGTFIMLNNQVEPEISINANEWTRFRFINAGPMKSHVIEMFDDHCTLFAIAQDSIFLDQPKPLTRRNFPITAGGRKDIAVLCADSGEDYTFDLTTGSGSFPGNTVNFTGTHSESDRIATVKVISSGTAAPPKPLPEGWFEDYFTGYLSDLQEETVDGEHGVMIFGRLNGKFAINYKIWSSEQLTYPEWKYTIDRVSDIVLTSEVAGPQHPFHQHLVPFQVVSASFDTTQVYGFDIVGTWFDSLQVPQGEYIVVRQRPDFLGRQIVHCHLLTHEDGGMMLSAEVVPDYVKDGCVDDNENVECCEPLPEGRAVEFCFGTATCVGAFDPFCIDNNWDAQCVQEAINGCSLICPV